MMMIICCFYKESVLNIGDTVSVDLSLNNIDTKSIALDYQFLNYASSWSDDHKGFQVPLNLCLCYSNLDLYIYIVRDRETETERKKDI